MQWPGDQDAFRSKNESIATIENFIKSFHTEYQIFPQSTKFQALIGIVTSKNWGLANSRYRETPIGDIMRKAFQKAFVERPYDFWILALYFTKNLSNSKMEPGM